MNPNLNFAQGVKGKNTGTHGGIIEGQRIPEIVDSIGLLENSPSFTDDDKQSLRSWFSDYLSWLLTSDPGKQEAKSANNHGTWYDVQVVTYALYTDKFTLAKQLLEDSKQTRITQQIEPDGKQPKEIKRSKSLDYSIYNLQGLCDLALLGDRVGVDLWNYSTPDGKGLKKAIEYLIPYSLQKESWSYEQITSPRTLSLRIPLIQASSAFKTQKYADVANTMVGRNAGNDIRDFVY